MGGDEFETVEAQPEREITLGTAMLVVIGFGVLLLCGLCFWIGLAAGRRGATTLGTAAAQSVEGFAAQEPAASSLAKPQAAGLVPERTSEPAVPEAAQPFGGAQTASDHALTSYAPAEGGSPATAAPAQVRPALPQDGSAAAPTSGMGGSGVQPALQQTSGVMVQVAALSKVEDARVLVNALRQRGYAAIARREPVDGLIHVRVGPFANRTEAQTMSQRLEGDGYNAEVQP
jgi:cell division septation protein DedD